MKLTQAERLTLWNQYEILKHLNPEEADGYEENQEILAGGYELLYPELNVSVSPEPVKDDATREVTDILNMFRAIHSSAKNRGYSPKSSYAEFDGFDGNESSGHYGYAKFVRRQQGRWDELSARPDNSHSSMSLPHYRDMLERWRNLGGDYDLTPDEIETIAG